MTNLTCKDITIFPNKSLEVQIDIFSFRKGFTLFRTDLFCSWKTDHAGFNIELTIMNLFFRLNFYDHRHWDDKTKKWEKCDD